MKKMTMFVVAIVSFVFATYYIFNFYQLRRLRSTITANLSKYTPEIRKSEVTLACQSFLTKQHTNPRVLDSYPDIIALGNLASCACMVDVISKAGLMNQVKDKMSRGIEFNLVIQSIPEAHKSIESNCSN